MEKKVSSSPVKPTSARLTKTPTAPTNGTRDPINPSIDIMIAEGAYFMYLNQGKPRGLDVHHWLKAEAAIEAYHDGRIATRSPTTTKNR